MTWLEPSFEPPHDFTVREPFASTMRLKDAPLSHAEHIRRVNRENGAKGRLAQARRIAAELAITREKPHERKHRLKLAWQRRRRAQR
jgi:hypothetical protein